MIYVLNLIFRVIIILIFYTNIFLFILETILKYHFGSIVLSSFVNITTKHLRIIFFWINKTLSLPFFFNELIYNIKEKFSKNKL